MFVFGKFRRGEVSWLARSRIVEALMFIFLPTDNPQLFKQCWRESHVNVESVDFRQTVVVLAQSVFEARGPGFNYCVYNIDM